ncbi:MAG: hypothetical protein ABSF50_22885 [Burkholderiaceae bacterium]
MPVIDFLFCVHVLAPAVSGAVPGVLPPVSGRTTTLEVSAPGAHGEVLSDPLYCLRSEEHVKDGTLRLRDAEQGDLSAQDATTLGHDTPSEQSAPKAP